MKLSAIVGSQIVLPNELKKELGIADNETVDCSVENGRLIISKQNQPLDNKSRDMFVSENDEIIILETNIDDCTGEVLGYTTERLFEEGARDAFYSPIYMKKNRPAYKLTVICDEKTVNQLEKIIFTETTTIGIRRRKEVRTCLKRQLSSIQTKYGMLDVKIAVVDGVEKIYPEYEYAKILAKENGVSLKEIYNSINK